MHTYEARVIADQATGRPLAGVRVAVEDAETGAPVQPYRDGAPVQLVTGAHGLITEWQTEDTTRRVALTAGPVRLTQWCLEALGDAASAWMLSRGEPGRGIQAITTSAADPQTATVTYTDGTTQSLQLPAGAAARSITSVGDPNAQGVFVITFSDGSTTSLTLPTPAVSWSGDRLTVGGKTGPSLTGPAPSIKIGTVTSGPTASATITGTPPDLTLGLVLPRADSGSAGLTITGPGRPDVPMTTAGKVPNPDTLPVGTQYISEDGASVGAFVWMKRPGGAWAVSVGDTGPRNVSSLITGAGVTVMASEPMTMRRVGDVVYFESGTISATSTGYRVIMAYPAGFGKSAPAAPVPLFQPWTDTSYNGIVNLHANGIYLRNSASLANCAGTGIYLTKNPWPTALPGTPA